MDAESIASFIRGRSSLAVTYVRTPSGALRPLTHGTGVLVEALGLHVFITCTHVLEYYWAARRAGQIVSIQISTASGSTGIELHSGYLLMPHKVSVIDGVESLYDHRDVGLIDVRAEDVDTVRQAKDFVPETQVNGDLPHQGEKLYTVGYPNLPGIYDANLHAAFPIALLRVCRVISVHDSLLIAEECTKDEELPASMNGPIDLHGTSGSGMFDAEGHLRGIYWGHDECDGTLRYFIVPSRAVVCCIRDYLHRRQQSTV